MVKKYISTKMSTIKPTISAVLVQGELVVVVVVPEVVGDNG
jgi:hypothetical protein